MAVAGWDNTAAGVGQHEHLRHPAPLGGHRRLRIAVGPGPARLLARSARGLARTWSRSSHQGPPSRHQLFGSGRTPAAAIGPTRSPILTCRAANGRFSAGSIRAHLRCSRSSRRAMSAGRLLHGPSTGGCDFSMFKSLRTGRRDTGCRSASRCTTSPIPRTSSRRAAPSGGATSGRSRSTGNSIPRQMQFGDEVSVLDEGQGQGVRRNSPEAHRARR